MDERMGKVGQCRLGWWAQAACWAGLWRGLQASGRGEAGVGGSSTVRTGQPRVAQLGRT